MQISAVGNETVFDQYVLPKRAMTKKAMEVTEIKIVNKKIYHKNAEVNHLLIKDALDNFVKFIGDDNSTILIAHNCKSFDMHILMNAFKNVDILEALTSRVLGFVDTLPMFKILHPKRISYSQVNLYGDILKETYDAHDSLQDVIALKRLANHSNPPIDTRESTSFTISSGVQVFTHKQQAKGRQISLRPMLDSKVISVGMSSKIAESGLTLAHLHLAYQRNGKEGIKDVLSEMTDGRVRVTKSQKIIDSISGFFHTDSEQ